MNRFFDTNILVYAFLDDPRRARAQEILAEGGSISAQTLNEFTNVSRRKHNRDWPEIERALQIIRDYVDAIAPLTEQTHDRALALARDHGLSFYDALILAAALEAGCDTLFTEGMQDGRVVEGLTIRNPFREGAP